MGRNQTVDLPGSPNGFSEYLERGWYGYWTACLPMQRIIFSVWLGARQGNWIEMKIPEQ